MAYLTCDNFRKLLGGFSEAEILYVSSTDGLS